MKSNGINQVFYRHIAELQHMHCLSAYLKTAKSNLVSPYVLKIYEKHQDIDKELLSDVLTIRVAISCFQSFYLIEKESVSRGHPLIGLLYFIYNL